MSTDGRPPEVTWATGRGKAGPAAIAQRPAPALHPGVPGQWPCAQGSAYAVGPRPDSARDEVLALIVRAPGSGSDYHGRSRWVVRTAIVTTNATRRHCRHRYVSHVTTGLWGSRET